MSEIRAIDTRYKGQWYRSRHEARWAVFLDTLGEPFQYELEGFELPPLVKEKLDPAGHWDPSEVMPDLPLFYVPDFWLPRVKQWVEIKPYRKNESVDDLTWEKAFRLEYHTADDVIIVCGTPAFVDADDAHEEIVLCSYTALHRHDWPYLWCECPACGAVGLEFSGRAERLRCCKEHKQHPEKRHNYDTPRLRQAFEVASRWRFFLDNPDALFQRNYREKRERL